MNFNYLIKRFIDLVDDLKENKFILFEYVFELDDFINFFQFYVNFF